MIPNAPSIIVKNAFLFEIEKEDSYSNLTLNNFISENKPENPAFVREIVYGVDKYHYVYERMVDYVFSNVMDITQYNPNAKWYLKKNGYAPKDASSLRPDTIRLEPIPSDSNTDEKVAYVLDAKFYRFGTTGNESDLPTTTSIQKQITYGDNIICNLQKKENITCVYNAFIMPFDKEIKNDDNYKYLW